MSHTPTPGSSKMDQILSQRKILITCGTGGVGKTTLSAALAIRAALNGRKTVVVTIDPAKRLANSLGLQTLQDEPTDLTPALWEAFEKTGQKNSSNLNKNGSLFAIVPDTRRTFETFVRELAPSAASAERVMRNPIFQIFAKEFSGTNEYMALERLLHLHQESPFDCIVLDTPPSRNTLAFLDAPQLLSRFFDEKLIRWLVLPANRLVAEGMKKALHLLERLTGAGFMTNLFDFASGLFEVQAKFTGSLKKVTELLESSQVGFLMVTAPTPETLIEANRFIERLSSHQLHFEGIVLNRTLDYLTLGTPPKGYEKGFEILRAIQARETKVTQNLLKNKIPVCAKIPELARDVHSMEDLIHVAMAFNSGLDSVVNPHGFGQS